jgi:hypothetical protein
MFIGRKLAWILGELLVIFLAALGGSLARPHRPDLLFKILSIHEGILVTQPYVSPVVNLKPSVAPVKSNSPGDIISCQQSSQINKFKDHEETVVVLICGTDTYTLDGVFFHE